MVRAVDLLRQGRNEELWQMCCGYLKLSLDQFMAIQNHLLLEQITLLNRSQIGKKLMPGRPETVAEFRKTVPLTTYRDYCPDLAEKDEAVLPAKPAYWVHTSGKSGEYPCKWVPLSEKYAHELSLIEYGIWMLSCGREWGDVSQLKENPKIVYTVAPPPYVSGTLARIVMEQSPADYLPTLKKAEGLPFDARIKLGFEQALSEGFDCFFGLSLILSVVGDKFSESLRAIDVMPFLLRPRALLRLSRGMIKSKRQKRPMLPKDLWSVKGIITSGLDSNVYKNKIERLWGKYPLDIYSSTEGGVIATQAWDYTGMTFIPNLNFLEFIPERECLKMQMDSSYQPETVLLDEVKAGEVYELVITSLHGGALVRYRIGDMVRITSLSNENAGIKLPQMAFERRADDIMDFGILRVTEKSVWQAIENTGVVYEDWVARKKTGSQVLDVYIEPKNGIKTSEKEIARGIAKELTRTEASGPDVMADFNGYIDFSVKVHLLHHGAFANYTRARQAEGADLAHLKPPHINPAETVMSLLLAKSAAPAVKGKKEAVPV